ncbi:hypothetical protein HGRIS_012508 [Hohenbuehelia grisea]|uniref:Uncharacterized protein n=1 Tax=Hohenbuehelia grisea TaxID=104357 RepID=A0ABR3ISJ4_9AGAR
MRWVPPPSGGWNDMEGVKSSCLITGRGDSTPASLSLRLLFRSGCVGLIQLALDWELGMIFGNYALRTVRKATDAAPAIFGNTAHVASAKLDTDPVLCCSLGSHFQDLI